jgi:tRNA pseudouridine55 synthase
MPFNFEAGELLLVDKPIHWTSFDVVNKIRKVSRCKKVGHAGTLDPRATGLLLIGTGAYTKQLQHLQDFDKTYTGMFHLGATRPSFDTETDIDAEYPIAHLHPDLIHATAKQFLGQQRQMPPQFSAVRHEGKKLYLSARKGEVKQVEPRRITIYAFEITHINIPRVHFSVTCSKGTYIRALANDFGKALQSGAYLATLCRTHIGQYDLANAWQLPQLIEVIKEQNTSITANNINTDTVL